jgi:hypothetical protein
MAPNDQLVSYDQLVAQVDQLPLVDKLRLMEHLAPKIAREVRKGSPRRSLRGLWEGVDISEEDIDEVKREMWSGFPRDDF